MNHIRALLRTAVTSRHAKLSFGIGAAALALLYTGMFALHTLTAQATTVVSIEGYAWSPDIGWIHFNGSGYGVQEDTSGQLSGYAWSQLGWISFNASELTGCPSGACVAQVDPQTGQLSGWARACAAFANKSACSGPLDSGAGGWDGWIHLSGVAADGSTYGVSSSNGCWSGFAWGSAGIGAISFYGTSTDGSTYGVGEATCNRATSGISAVISGQGCILSSGTNPTCNVDAWWSVTGLPSGDSLGLQVTGPGFSVLYKGTIMQGLADRSNTRLANLAASGLYTGLSAVVGKSSPFTLPVGAGTYTFQLLDIHNSATSSIGSTIALAACPAGDYIQTDASGNETCTSIPPGSLCNPGSTACVGNAVTHYDLSCNVTQTDSPCSYQCSNSSGAASCLPLPTPSGTLSLNARPSLVGRGATSTISWDINNVKSCSNVSANAGPDQNNPWSPQCTSNGDGTEHCQGATSTSPISVQTTYSMSCTDFSGNPVPITPAVVNVVPLYQER